MRRLLPCFALLLAACGSSSSGSSASPSETGGSGGSATGGEGGAAGGEGGAAGGASAGSSGAGGALVVGDWDPTPIGGDRPTKVYVPSSYVPGTPMPVVILLHGYGASGTLQEALFQLEPQAESRGFLYAHPDGTFDQSGKRFWNATDACCAFAPNPPDDSAYLAGLVAEIAARWTVDPKRVFFAGHSNGGFMSYRMACDHADTIGAIVSLAGDMYADASKCSPSGPVAVLQIHGTADQTVPYDGGTVAVAGGLTVPSAKQSVLDWVAFDGCGDTADTSEAPLDLDTELAGAETTREVWASMCKAGTDAELWSIAGGKHIPSLSPAFAPAIVEWMLAHPKP